MLKLSLYIRANLPNIPFSQISQEQTSFYFKIHSLTVKKRIKLLGNHIHVNKFVAKEIKNQPQTTTLNTRLQFFQTFQKHHHQFNFTETYDPNSKDHYLNDLQENMAKDPIALPKSIIGYIDFPN